jgi:hypothetical protein
MTGGGVAAALGTGALITLLLGLALVGCLVGLAATVLLSGLRVDATATGIGTLAAVLLALVVDVADAPAVAVVASLPLGYVGGFATGRQSGLDRRRLCTGPYGQSLLTAFAVGAVGSAALCWVVLAGFLGAALPATLLANPGTAIQIGVLTGGAVVVGVGARRVDRRTDASGPIE